ncbi:alpha-humulene/(-)-(E)-beta-caryophyllene synthase [Citrus sinensis]|uniref:Alpha-humulene/(-)-(E)-beta-caryophyllene synthase n=1 Tax=Citrus sinensis TaxID=2711 RepID=A0ACB8P122_CITSI|nr:alpha-humulene/(-)-(E)-beta-caryophyllene synthase [Citrus sinensis]
MSTPVPTVVEETVRPIAGFSPTVWGNHFLKSASDFKAIDATTQELYEALKQEIRMMITATADKIADKLHLIDAVQRLGVAYHFEKEIEDELEKILDHLDNDNIGGDDFYTLSLSFRLLRQQGVKISCDVFEKFKNNEGKFKASMINDVQVMLSLYEAAHLAINGEDILDEAIVFTTTHLKSMVSHASPNLAEQINHALKLPLRKALPRLEARYFLDVCSRGDRHDKSLLKFAKLDFNLLQAAHQKEVSDMTRWWIDLDFSTKLPYARDRIVELYFWILMGAYYEPKYAFGRIFMSKLISMISILDDTFDAYGTYDELKLFVEAVKRWDIGAIDTLPEYMKFIYKSLLDVYDKAEESLAKEGRSSYGVKYMEESIMMYFSEAKWLHEGFLPKIEEYEGVALGSSGVLTLATASFVDMGDIATKEAFEWLIKKPKIVVAAQTIGRLMDDIASHEFEQKRGHIPSAVECYMKQHGVSEEEAKKALRIQVDNAWKDINEELLSPTAVSLPLLERILNLARVCHFMYEDGDRYTQPLLMKDQVALVLKDPVTL